MTVRFTLSGVTRRLFAIDGIAGKYMFDENAENIAAIATIVTIMRLWIGLKCCEVPSPDNWGWNQGQVPIPHSNYLSCLSGRNA